MSGETSLRTAQWTGGAAAASAVAVTALLVGLGWAPNGAAQEGAATRAAFEEAQSAGADGGVVLSDGLATELTSDLASDLASDLGSDFGRGLTGGLAGALGETPTLAFDCLIEPRAEIALTSEVSGVLEETMVGRGDAVRAGQRVARLASGPARAALALAEERAAQTGELEARRAQAEYERRRFERHEQLIARKLISGQEADEIATAVSVAEFELQAALEAQREAERELERARARLAEREIASPVDGVVLSRDLQPGEFVDGDAIYTIVALDPLHVEAFVPIAHASLLSEGAVVAVRTEGADALLGATVTVIDRVADAASGTFKMRLELPNPDFAIMAGLKCAVLPEADIPEG